MWQKHVCKKLSFYKIFFLLSFLHIASNAQTKVTLVTEEYPPFNMVKNDKIVGISTEIIQEVFKRANIDYTIEVYPWLRAMHLALRNKNTAVYSTTRTPEREKKFKWVGPLVKNDWAFYAKKGSKIKISRFDDAKNFVVGGYNGDAVSEYLLKNGFIEGKNIELTTNDRSNALKLRKGRIDLWATGTKLGPFLAKEENFYEMELLFVFQKTEMYAAFNLQTDTSLIHKLNVAIRELKADGKIQKINKKYLH